MRMGCVDDLSSVRSPLTAMCDGLRHATWGNLSQLLGSLHGCAGRRRPRCIRTSQALKHELLAWSFPACVLSHLGGQVCAIDRPARRAVSDSTDVGFCLWFNHTF